MDRPPSYSPTATHSVPYLTETVCDPQSLLCDTDDRKSSWLPRSECFRLSQRTSKLKGRLQPGKMFLLDFEAGQLVADEAVKSEYSAMRPYQQWLSEQKLTLESFSDAPSHEPLAGDALVQRMRAFGYTTETMQFMLRPMITDLRDPLGSMGNDSALACLSDKSRMVYDYFKQLFAQVTNPAIDSIREEVVMSLGCFVGPEGNLVNSTEAQAKRLHLAHPILSTAEMAKLKTLEQHDWRTQIIDITFDHNTGTSGLKATLDRICEEASTAIKAGFSLIVLSDRAVSSERMAVSALAACGAVHHHLIGTHERTRIGLLLETAEAREVHHFCLLTGYGADGINPYLALDALWQAREEHLLDPAEVSSQSVLTDKYKKAVGKGMLKVMGKMGISTLQSYKGAQIFEAIGLAKTSLSAALEEPPVASAALILKPFSPSRCKDTVWVIPSAPPIT